MSEVVDERAMTETHDPSLAAFANEQVRQTNQDIAHSYGDQAVSTARGLLNAPDNFNSGLSYGDHATSEAIKSRYQQKYMQGENQLRTDIMKNAQSDHLRNLQVATDAAGKEVELNKQKALLKWKIDQANKHARGAIVGQTLGIVGAVVGAVAGGYATAGTGAVAGGAAGYQAGQGLGQAIGGN